MTTKKSPRAATDVQNLLERFGAAEADFLQRDFLAPAQRGERVNVRIAGVSCRLRIAPKSFEGWGVFRPLSHSTAKWVRRPSMAERRAYLQLFPMIRMIICHRSNNTWFASAANFGDRRFRVEGMAPLRLVDEVQLFDCARARFDGQQFWFDELDMRHDPGAAAYLRAALADQTHPTDLARRGLTAEERAAYELNYWALLRPPQQSNTAKNVNIRRRLPTRPEDLAETDLVAARLRENLSHGGAQLVEYLERADGYRVRYSVEGRNYTSSVNKDDLTVQVAGICLSGEDEKFDLASLVGVLREGHADGGIYEVGDHGLPEEEYWRIHP